MVIQPSELDKRAARSFCELSGECNAFDVKCKFAKRMVDRSRWVKDESLRRRWEFWFGNGAEYFTGAREYVRLATGWRYAYKALTVSVLKAKGGQSSGLALLPWGEMRLRWGSGEFVLTVLHELVHLFNPDESEVWVEDHATRLVMGI